MTARCILLFEHFLLVAQIFPKEILLSSREKATAAAAADQDGWHDEAYKAAAYEVAMRGTRLVELKAALQTANVIEPDQIVPGEEADIGAVVTFKLDRSLAEETYLLTGNTVAPESGLITIYSPLGKALRGSRRSSTVEIELPDGLTRLEVADVSFDISAILVDYLRGLYEGASRPLKQLLTPSRLSNMARNMRISAAANQRDYLETRGLIAAQTAPLEAILLTIQAYHLSTSLEGDCRIGIASCRRAFEEYEIPFPSLHESNLL